MRWALLGAEKETAELARTFAAAPGLELIVVPPTEWEALLARNDVDAVIVATGLDESLRAEQLKKLVGAGISVVAVHPAADVLTAYEVEVIRRETGGKLVAFAPGWQHPAWDLLCDLVSLGDGSPLGRTEHVHFERYISDRQRTPVLRQFSQDVHVLRRLLGNITGINAVGDTRQDGSWTSLAVHFSSERECSATWSITAPNAPVESRVNVSGSQATATLLIFGGPGDEKWELRDSVGYRELFPPWDDAAPLIEQLKSTTPADQRAPNWTEACLDLEIAEAAEKSLRRKRTIDLHTSERSEEKTFKGVMAATGCLVLVAVFFIFLGVALWDGFRAPFRDRETNSVVEREKDSDAPPEVKHDFPLWVRLWPVYPVFAFLLLQFLLVVARPKADDGASAAGK